MRKRRKRSQANERVGKTTIISTRSNDRPDSSTGTNDAKIEIATAQTVPWPTLLQDEAKARSIAMTLGETPEGPRLLRRWWEIVSKVMLEYARHVARGAAPEPPPSEVAVAVGHVCGHLATGDLPDPIALAIKGGRRRPGPLEEYDIGLAVAYCLASRPEGIDHLGINIKIDDPDPIERIHLWYGAKKRTVYDWIKKHPPAFLGATGANAGTLQHLTFKAAQRYREAGRSHGALTKRGVRPKRVGRTTRRRKNA